MDHDNGYHGQQPAGVVAAPDRRTRRRLLAGAAGVLGVAAAGVVAAAAPAQADNSNPVLQGTDNGYPTRRTAVFTPNNTEIGILADPNQSGKGSLGVYGLGNTTGVLGEGGSGSTQVPGGDGVRGDGGPDGGLGGGNGVVGTGGAGAFGVAGTGGNFGGTGMAGTGGPGGDGVGVTGQGSGNGHGVTGAASGSGTGVWGTAGGPGSNGARGTAGSASTIGVLAENTGGGTALQVSGPAVFNRSGLLTVAAGKSSATQTGVALSPASLVLAVVQQNLSGVYVRAAVPNITGSSFTVYLSKAPTATAKVAWFVVN